MLVFSTNWSLTESQGGSLALFRLFFSIRRFWVVLDGKSWQEYAINAGISHGPFRCPTLFLVYINDLSMLSVVLLSMQMILFFMPENSMPEKLNLFHLTVIRSLELLIWKLMDLFLKRNNLLWCWDGLSRLSWMGALWLSLLLKLPSKMGALICFMIFLFLRLLLHGILLSCVGWCSCVGWICLKSYKRFKISV